jgi:hypothetical protein
MSSFTTPADLRLVGRYKFELLAHFDFHIGAYPSENVVSVPAGFVTDFASVPRLLWSVFPPHGKWAKAAIVHDYLYATAKLSRSESDKIFLEAMCVLEVPKVKRILMYLAVRLFGASSYKGK